jgi:hypothetical protein
MTAEPDPYLTHEPKAHRLLLGWWLCRDTGIARHYAPKPWEELVKHRCEIASSTGSSERLRRSPKGQEEQHEQHRGR